MVGKFTLIISEMAVGIWSKKTKKNIVIQKNSIIFADYNSEN